MTDANRLTLLDCTLRDGGYYNDWKFSNELVHAYLEAVAQAGIDIIELGFRSFPKDHFLGALAYTTDDYIRQLKLPTGVRIGVMVNAADFVNYAEGGEAGVNKLFVARSESPVEIVRLAAHFHEVEKLGPCIRRLKEMGYVVGLNLMQISNRNNDEIASVGTMAASYGVDVLYFADSLGSLEPKDVDRIIQAMASTWKGPLGVHTHDNMGLALGNTVQGVLSGATWLDSTVLGMGRGPGNVRTEYLLMELGRRFGLKTNVAPLLRLLADWFEPMQRDFGWGPNPYYFLSGMYGIHPTYVQEMLSDGRYSSEDILGALEFIRRSGGDRFSAKTLASARSFYADKPSGTWSAEGWAQGRDVLLLAAGPGASEHRLGLESFVRRDRPLVIALNTESPLPIELIDAHAACHPVRLLMDAPKYRSLGTPVALPLTMLPDDVKATLDGTQCLDYGVSIQPGKFDFGKNGSVVPSPLVAAYALALATAAGAKRILLAGFDGYSSDDPRQGEMREIFEAYQATEGSVPLLAVTPSRYPISAGSVYAHWV